MTDLVELVLDHNVQEGFYSWDNDTLNYSPNFVQWPDGFIIQRAEKETYEYPIRGYYWFETRAQALSFFEKPDPNIDPSLPDDLAMIGVYGDLPSNNAPIAPDIDYDELIKDPEEFLYKPEDLEYDSGKPPPQADDAVGNPPDMHPPHAY